MSTSKENNLPAATYNNSKKSNRVENNNKKNKPSLLVPSSPTTQLVLTKPTTTDIILGRGKGVGSLPGNRLFCSTIKAVRPTYQKAMRSEKVSVARSVIKQVQQLDPPGRFLEPVCCDGKTMKKDQNHGLYVQVDMKRVIEKVCQALRDKPNKRKNLSRDRKKFAITTNQQKMHTSLFKTSPFIMNSNFNLTDSLLGVDDIHNEKASSSVPSNCNATNLKIGDTSDAATRRDEENGKNESYKYGYYHPRSASSSVSDSPSSRDSLPYNYECDEDITSTVMNTVSQNHPLFSSSHIISPEEVEVELPFYNSGGTSGILNNDVFVLDEIYCEDMQYHHQQPMSLYDRCFYPVAENTSNNAATVQDSCDITADLSSPTAVDGHMFWMDRQMEETMLFDSDLSSCVFNDPLY